MGPSFGDAAPPPWFTHHLTHHLRMDPDMLDFEVVIPVTPSIAALGRGPAAQLPARTPVRTVRHEARDGLAAAWGAFDAWLATDGHAPASDSRVARPDAGLNASTWRTAGDRPRGD
jgi:hypothetical protein